jgi:hypothetical protein
LAAVVFGIAALAFVAWVRFWYVRRLPASHPMYGVLYTISTVLLVGVAFALLLIVTLLQNQ